MCYSRSHAAHLLILALTATLAEASTETCHEKNGAHCDPDPAAQDEDLFSLMQTLKGPQVLPVATQVASEVKSAEHGQHASRITKKPEAKQQAAPATRWASLASLSPSAAGPKATTTATKAMGSSGTARITKKPEATQQAAPPSSRAPLAALSPSAAAPKANMAAKKAMGSSGTARMLALPVLLGVSLSHKSVEVAHHLVRSLDSGGAGGWPTAILVTLLITVVVVAACIAMATSTVENDSDRSIGAITKKANMSSPHAQRMAPLGAKKSTSPQRQEPVPGHVVSSGMGSPGTAPIYGAGVNTSPLQSQQSVQQSVQHSSQQSFSSSQMAPAAQHLVSNAQQMPPMGTRSPQPVSHPAAPVAQVSAPVVPRSGGLSLPAGAGNSLPAIESRFAISINELERAGARAILEVVSTAGLPLLQMKVVDGKRLEVGLTHTSQSSMPRCALQAPEVKGGAFTIFSAQGVPHGQLKTISPGLSEVSIDNKVIMMVEGSSSTLSFSVTSPRGAPVALARVNNCDYPSGDHFEVRALPGSDAILVLCVLLALAIFTA